MRRFSQRSQLVTLSDLNVTPLLDLAFVLLIIFVITTPLMEQSIDLLLPVGSAAPARPEPKDVVMAEVSPEGVYYFQGRPVAGLAALEEALVAEFRRNPNMVVRIRADAGGIYQYPVNILDACRRNGITRFDLATEGGR